MEEAVLKLLEVTDHAVHLQSFSCLASRRCSIKAQLDWSLKEVSRKVGRWEGGREAKRAT